MPNGLYPRRNMIKSRNEFLALLKEEAYKKGDFKLSSGRKSEHYVNCKPVTLQGDALMFVSWCMFECIEEDCDAVGGLTLGADPLVAGVPIVAAIEERPMDGLIVRKEPKGHGTQAWIEGPELAPGSKVTVLEDVITTGGSAIKALTNLPSRADTRDTPLTNGSAPRVNPPTTFVFTSFNINKLVRVSPRPLKVTGLQFT